MSLERAPGCPPAVEVERHSAGEAVAAKAHIEACAHCGAYVQELQAAAEAFLKQRPAELFLPQVARRAQTPAARPWLHWLSAGFGAVAVASLAAIVLPELLAPADDVRLKGASIEVFYKRGTSDPARVLDGASLEPGDTLRFRYRGEKKAQLALFERDASGAVTVFAPFGGAQSGERDRDEFFADAVAVDATLGTSTLYIVQSQTPFELAPVVEAIRAAREPSCRGCTVRTLHFEKVP